MNASKYNVYEIKDGKPGKYVKVRNDEIENPIGNIDPVKASFLRGNPFMYNPETVLYKITSLEEYTIPIKKKEMAFGDAIRNPQFSVSKRRKLIKTAFKTWNKDYLKQKNNAFTENDKIVEIIGDVSYLKFSWKIRILLYALFLFSILMMGINSQLWDFFARSSVGSYFRNVLMNLYQSFEWLKIIGNIAIYIILLSIFYASIYSIISRDFAKNYRLAQSYLDRSETTISRSYRNRWKRARRYYLSSIKKKKSLYFPPLDISAVQEGQINITIFKEICQVLVDRAYKFKKSKPFIIAFRNIIIFLSIGLAATLFVFLIYGLIMSIF
ncbi:MAG: hypothetical protein GX661_02605 [Acholeplasmataceae bacterium]|nr:hypothetical protein [Acholeplasmataceae bacterium]